MNKFLPTAILSAALGVYLLIPAYSAKASQPDVTCSAETYFNPYGDSIIIHKQHSSKKHKIRLYPDAMQESLLFAVKGEEGKVYQLFLFDLDGQLVKQANIRHRETTILRKIEKGDYTFEVFSDDERIENGHLVVK